MPSQGSLPSREEAVQKVTLVIKNGGLKDMPWSDLYDAVQCLNRIKQDDRGKFIPQEYMEEAIKILECNPGTGY